MLPTLSEDRTKPISGTTSSYSHKSQFLLLQHLLGKIKNETVFIIPNNHIYTGNYDLVGPAEEDYNTLIYNGNCPEYAEVNDCFIEKPLRNPPLHSDLTISHRSIQSSIMPLKRSKNVSL